MKKPCLVLAWVLLSLSGSAQQKSITPLPAAASAKAGATTYAVVVGISDYQDPAVPDLRFADKDAEAYAKYLQSPSGGSLNNDHFKLLTNAHATTAQIASALDWLIDVCKEGDEAVIYFSGHGDVETKTMFQLGYLLTWDSPPQSYVSGAFPLYYLQSVVSTLSLKNKSHVLLITDACHAGKLAGNTIGGAELTSANLSKQFANETKILSCQPGEFSIEGEQWGGGRGAFSFHLVEALYGLADKNTDQQVSLGEVDRYLEDHVTAEVAPQVQAPMVFGNKTERLATVFPEILAAVLKSKSTEMSVFSKTENRGLEDEVLAAVDSSVRQMYRHFKQALAEKRFFPDSTGMVCADVYYEKLTAEPKLQKLHASMRRNYAAALQDDAQQAINNLMKMERTETRLYRLERLKKYAPYPRQIARAAELLGSEHYAWRTLEARRYFFEGVVLQLESPLNPDTLLGRRISEKFHASLALQPEAALTYSYLAWLFRDILPNPDSLLFYAQKAIDAAPNRLRGYTNLAWGLNENRRYHEVKECLDKAFAIDSSQALVWSTYGGCLYWQGKLDESVPYLLKAIALDSTYEEPYNKLGTVYYAHGKINESIALFLKAAQVDKPSANTFNWLGSAYYNIGQYDKAELYLKKGLEIEPNDTRCLTTLAATYLKVQRIAEAKALIQRAVDYDSTNLEVILGVGEAFDDNGLYAEAEAAARKCIALDSTNIIGWYELGRLCLHAKRYTEAEQALQKALAIDPKDWWSLICLGQVYKAAGRYGEARQVFLNLLAMNENNPINYAHLAMLEAVEGHTTASLDYAEKAFQKGMRYEAIYKDPEFDFAPVRSLSGFKELERKYFPDQH